MPQLLVTVVNYDFERNAELLLRVFRRSFPTLLIDADSPRPPRGTDISIPNTYYPGLWNEAVHQAINGNYEWLLFIASDVQLRNPKQLEPCINEACTNESIGVWTPSVHRASRCASKLVFTRNSGGLRQCSYAEGFCFMARTNILKQQHPLPSWNKSGWGVDVVTSWLATEAGYKVCVDDRPLVYHPRARHRHRIERDPAYDDLTRYCAEFGLDEAARDRFFYSDYEQLQLEQAV